MINNIEEKREQLNYELHHLLNVIEIIYGLKGDYLKYKDYEGVDEAKYLEEQIKLVVDAKDRLMNIFKS